MGAQDQTAIRERLPQPTRAERQVADLLPIGADEAAARAVLDRVPLWFHTFSLDEGSCTRPGWRATTAIASPSLPDDLAGKSVLDVGTFDGFYAFLAEAAGRERVVAVDNEQYREWVLARWGVELEGGEGFRAIAELLDSEVEYRRLDAFELDQLDEPFDLIFCFGILHRVESPLGLLKVLRRRLAGAGYVLLETYGVVSPELEREGAIHVCGAG